jgi:hypothetical protein
MIVTLSIGLFLSLDDVRAYLNGAVPVGFLALAGDERRNWVADTFAQFPQFAFCHRRDNGAALGLAREVTGLLRAHLTRLVAQGLSTRNLDDPVVGRRCTHSVGATPVPL